MNMDTARMLSTIPERLKMRGWRFVQNASWMTRADPPACTAVYVRRYEAGIDDVSWAEPDLYGFIRATSETSMSPSWREARKQAVARMDEIDATRTRP
jgi:hypothetical protein